VLCTILFKYVGGGNKSAHTLNPRTRQSWWSPLQSMCFGNQMKYGSSVHAGNYNLGCL